MAQSPSSRQVRMSMLDALGAYYTSKIRPLEECLKKDKILKGHLLDQVEIKSLPNLLVVGAKSVGKTTFVNNLIQSEYAGSAKQTNNFFVILSGDENALSPLSEVVKGKNFPYPGLKNLPQSRNCFVSYCTSAMLRQVNIVDSPGCALGIEQTEQQLQDFQICLEYFAQRADAILLVIDASRNDLVESGPAIMKFLAPMHSKIMVISNKADKLSVGEIYNSRTDLIWNLRHIMESESMPGTFFVTNWNVPVTDPQLWVVFKTELRLLFTELSNLCENYYSKRVNNVVNRAVIAQSLGTVLPIVKKEGMFKWKAKKSNAKLKRNIKHNLIPEIKSKYQMESSELSALENVANNVKRHYRKKNMFSKIMMRKVRQFITEDAKRFQDWLDQYNALMLERKTGQSHGKLSWYMVEMEARKNDWRQEFRCNHPSNNTLDFKQIENLLLDSNVPAKKKIAIWNLVDSNGDGLINEHEFFLLRYLLRHVSQGLSLPKCIGERLKPPPVVYPSTNFLEMENNKTESKTEETEKEKSEKKSTKVKKESSKKGKKKKWSRIRKSKKSKRNRSKRSKKRKSRRGLRKRN